MDRALSEILFAVKKPDVFRERLMHSGFGETTSSCKQLGGNRPESQCWNPRMWWRKKWRSASWHEDRQNAKQTMTVRMPRQRTKAGSFLLPSLGRSHYWRPTKPPSVTVNTHRMHTRASCESSRCELLAWVFSVRVNYPFHEFGIFNRQIQFNCLASRKSKIILRLFCLTK